MIEDRREVPSGKSFPVSRLVDSLRGIFGNRELPGAEHFNGSLMKVCYLPIRYNNGWLSILPYTSHYTGIRVLASQKLQFENRNPFIGSNVEIQYLADSDRRPAGEVIGEQFVQTGPGDWDHIEMVKAVDGKAGVNDFIPFRKKGIEEKDLKRGVAILRFVDYLHYRDRVHPDKVFDPVKQPTSGKVVVVGSDPNKEI